jgi:CRISPR-associated endonuclease/helicase Cas3
MENLRDKGFSCEPYPHDRGVVLTSRRRLGKSAQWFRPLDDGDDTPSRNSSPRPVLLGNHLQHVADTFRQSPASALLDDLGTVIGRALELHDVGKADQRFQAMLRRTDRTDAWLLAGRAAEFIAKSGGYPTTPTQRREARIRAGLPEGFRHEMLSVQLAEQTDDLPGEPVLRDLVLHLIASHHGCARPLAPVVVDDEPPPIEVHGLSLSAAQRRACPAHRLDSGIAERFWSLTRRFGWWGLAYLEALARLADQQASAAEDAGRFDSATQNTDTEPTP